MSDSELVKEVDWEIARDIYAETFALLAKEVAAENAKHNERIQRLTDRMKEVNEKKHRLMCEGADSPLVSEALNVYAPLLNLREIIENS